MKRNPIFHVLALQYLPLCVLCLPFISLPSKLSLTLQTPIMALHPPIMVEIFVCLVCLASYEMDLVDEFVGARWFDYFNKIKALVYPGLIIEFWSNVRIEGKEIVASVLGVHVSVSRTSISKATSCLDEGLIYRDGWDREFYYVDRFLLCKDEDVLENASQMNDKAIVLHKILNNLILPNDVGKNDEKVIDLQNFCLCNLLQKQKSIYHI